MSLVFRVCELDDTGTYSVEITEFVKNGEKDQTDCWLEVEGKYLYYKYGRRTDDEKIIFCQSIPTPSRPS